MILSPIQNTAIFTDGSFMQKRPVITQGFGERPEVYAQFGLKGHNGIDLRAAEGTPLFSPIEGTLTVIDQGNKGYGLHVKITKDNVEIVLAHLSKVLVKTGTKVYLGEKIALSGNTGFSSAAHLHMGMKFLDSKGRVLDSDNGYHGSVDPSEQVITWKGTLMVNTL